MAAEKVVVTTPTDREVVITRTFDAPRRLIWDCHTKPELVRQWLLGPPGWQMPVCSIDLKVGGKYRYEWKNTDGRTMGLGGTFREIAAPERLVANEMFDDDWTGGETTVTQVFDERAGATTLTLTVLYNSKKARDGAIATGMTSGLDAGYDRLEALAKSLP
jgi:uncharacterized protein YndB with AHSA1/START domain